MTVFRRRTVWARGRAYRIDCERREVGFLVSENHLPYAFATFQSKPSLSPKANPHKQQHQRYFTGLGIGFVRRFDIMRIPAETCHLFRRKPAT